MDNCTNSPTLIILAGGKSSRMGTPKGLLSYNNSYWLLTQIEQFNGTEVCIGLGFDSSLYLKAIPWLQDALTKTVIYKQKRIRVVLNPHPKYGLFSNIQTVLKTISTNASVFILPIDVPLFGTEDQEKLSSTNNLIVIPVIKNIKGHPIKLDPSFWQPLTLLKLSESIRLDHIIKKRKASEISFVNVSDAFCIKNLNTPLNWQAFIAD